MAVSAVQSRRCGICGVHLPGDLKHFYANAGNPGGLSKCCKVCADKAKKKYKAKYNRNQDVRIGTRKTLKISLSDRVQYALLTQRCPRCGGSLQCEKDRYEKDAPCLTCLICAREVWLPDRKEQKEFLANPPTVVAMPSWVKKSRRRKQPRLSRSN